LLGNISSINNYDYMENLVKNGVLRAFVGAWNSLSFNIETERELLWVTSNLLTFGTYTGESVRNQPFI